jgi:hypothetical protein
MDNGLDSFQRAMGMNMDSDPSIQKAKAKRDIVKDRERLREYDEKGSMAALGFAHGAIEHYFDRTEQAEKRVAELEEQLREVADIACRRCEYRGECSDCPIQYIE